MHPEPPKPAEPGDATPPPAYSPQLATPTESLNKLLVFRGIHPLYGAFLLDQLGIANRDERLQALESVLEVPRPLLRYLRVPDDVPPGPLATTRLDEDLIRRGLMLAPKPPPDPDEEEDEEEERPPRLAEKLFLHFEATYPEVTDVNVQAVWAAGELLRFNGNFNLFVKARDLVKQEGILFRHCLRLILLCGEFAQLCPKDADPAQWQAELRDISDRLTASCREVDPASTDEIVEQAHAADVVEGEGGTPVS